MSLAMVCQGVRRCLSARTCIARTVAIRHQAVIQAPYIAYRDYSSTAELPPIVTYDEVVKALEDSSAVVIDVRQAEELERDGVIPGALHIPLADLEVCVVCSV